MKDEPGQGLRIEVRALLRHPLAPPRDREDLVESRLAQDERHIRDVLVRLPGRADREPVLRLG